MAKKKGILKTLAVGALAVGVIGVGIGTAYHFKDNIKNWFDNIVNPEPTPTPTPTPGTNEDVNHSSGGVYVDGKEIGKNDVVSYIPKTIKFTNVSSRTSDNAIVGSSVTINASVLPENATNKNITWSLAWDEQVLENSEKYEYDYNKINEYISIKSNDSYNNSITITLNHVIYDHVILTGKTADGATCSIDINMISLPAKISLALNQGTFTHNSDGITNTYNVEQVFLDDDIYLKYRNIDNQLYDSHVNLENNSTGCNGPYISSVLKTGVNGTNKLGSGQSNYCNGFRMTIDEFYGDDFLLGENFYIACDYSFTNDFLSFCESKGESSFINCFKSITNDRYYMYKNDFFPVTSYFTNSSILNFYSPNSKTGLSEYENVYKFGQLVDEFTKKDDALAVFYLKIKIGLLKKEYDSVNYVPEDNILIVSTVDYLFSPGVDNYVASTDIDVDSDNITFGK